MRFNIDGGSCANVVFQSMVNKLKLAMSPYHNAYLIQWLNQGKCINISSQILLNFSISTSYKEEFWRDVVPMDACHVLLGMP